MTVEPKYRDAMGFWSVMRMDRDIDYNYDCAEEGGLDLFFFFKR